jgi:hypothetical protein
VVEFNKNTIQCPTCKKYFIKKSKRTIYCSKYCKDKFKKRDYQKSHGRVRSALNNGTRTKPINCEICDEKKRLCAHHPDYGDPLEILWVCYSCHGKIHAKN